MGRAVRWRFCTKRTRIERVRQRRSVILRDAGITERTQCRYFVGLRRILPILESSKSPGDMDGKIAEWIQDCWERGDVLHQISDALCGLHHYEPWTRKQLPESWKVFAVWRKLESPNRAPPLTATVINAWLMYCIQHCDLEFGALIALGFYALLRTGEMLPVRPCDLLLGPDNGVVSLSDTKTGLRNAAKETVSLITHWRWKSSALPVKSKRNKVSAMFQYGLGLLRALETFLLTTSKGSTCATWFQAL